MKRPLPCLGLISLPAVLACASVVAAADWPHMMGPHHNRKVDATIPTAWAGGQPKKLWEIPVGGGFSSFVTGAGRANTVVPVDGRETVMAVDRATGLVLWRTPFCPAVCRLRAVVPQRGNQVRRSARARAGLSRDSARNARWPNLARLVERGAAAVLLNEENYLNPTRDDSSL